MKNKNGEFLELLESKNNSKRIQLKEVAETFRIFVDELVAQGFTKQEAMCMAIMFLTGGAK